MEYYQRLTQLNLCSVYGRLQRTDLIKYWKSFHPIVDVGLSNLLVVAPALGARGHVFKLSHTSCNTDIKIFF